MRKRTSILIMRREDVFLRTCDADFKLRAWGSGACGEKPPVRNVSVPCTPNLKKYTAKSTVMARANMKLARKLYKPWRYPGDILLWTSEMDTGPGFGIYMSWSSVLRSLKLGTRNPRIGSRYISYEDSQKKRIFGNRGSICKWAGRNPLVLGYS
ncbi:hypothetical protein P154DRAFT_306475 [Amniculicola lignicola CBS 123094]|uniref:Uncharacterized protein n=1 Tax=Amniculicola lignicola CBS 123094 TaxID=1392246 RepID=A0A6A5W4K2_9PLEO|nr:hypothetical protein P154DRAFT_306475 [Amniculicola lignicola CBS 123094]